MLESAAVIAFVTLLSSFGFAQGQPQQMDQTMTQHEHMAVPQEEPQQQNTQIPAHAQMESAPSADQQKEAPGDTEAMRSMDHHHMDMGPHMTMTALRDPQPGDAQKAAAVVAAARTAAEHYADYHVALNEGFHIFLPNVPQPQYHFTNRDFAIENAFHFNPEHPTSLLYEKSGDGYKLVGVMYTARKNATEAELNERIPLSVAQWHAHVNFCVPNPGGPKGQLFTGDPKFGFRGSIATKEACDAAGGYFLPQVFGWMVHVYPFETTQAAIWSVERQHAGHDDMH